MTERSGEMASTGSVVLNGEERERLRAEIIDACRPVAQIWPLRTFAYRNPLRGFEHLPFDQAVRAGRRLLGGSGYLPTREYRQFYRDGRITEEGVRRALRRLGPNTDAPPIRAGARAIDASEVLRAHLVFGVNALEPSLLPWTLNAEGATERLRSDLPNDARRRILERARRETEAPPREVERRYVSDLWAASETLGLRQASTDEPHGDGGGQRAGEVALEPTLPAQRTVSDWVDSLTEASLVGQINAQMIKWVSAFLDAGLAGWQMPSRHRGFYESWRELASRDLSCRFLGIKSFGRKVRDLPDSPEEAVAQSLRRLGIPTPDWPEYQSRQFAQLPGWTGLIRWLGENPEYEGQRGRPIDPVHYLAARLFYEAELVESYCRREWGIPGDLSSIVSYWRNRPDEYGKLAGRDSYATAGETAVICQQAWRLFQLAQCLELTPAEVESLSSTDAQKLLEWLDSFPEEDHGPVWLEAYEDAYREQLIGRLIAHRGRAPEGAVRPRAQLIFCIDARSEPFRRYIEAQGPYETFGYAGFFGAAISHQAFDSAERFALCPVLLKPAYSVREEPRPGQQGPLEAYASGTRWRRLGDELFHDLKANPVASFMLIDVIGLFYSLGLIGKTLARKPFEIVRGKIRRWFSRPVSTHVPVAKPAAETATGVDSEPPQGFTLEQQATVVENGLKIIGLTRNFGRFVVACGHGSASENNPYAAAYNCGACGGSDGDPNARVFASMANDPEVRRVLRGRGLEIPDDVWFLAGKHNTATDRVAFYDLADLPPTHAEDFLQLTRDLEEAGAEQALERCGRLPGAPKGMSPGRAASHALARAADWANVRPEWGLSSNAAFLIGRRRMSYGLDLGSRVFLHSYDPDADANGEILEKIMMAPLIVGEWINTEYYFSAVDPWVYGSGSKVIHNVVGGVGVMLGSQGDLQGGLPLQSVNDGAVHYHEPMRLLALIEAPRDRISAIIQKHTALQELFQNQWVNLAAIEPATFDVYRYNADSTWEALELQPAA